MYAWPFLISFVTCSALMPVARRLSYRFGMLDEPSPRKNHREPTPLLGGLAIYGGFCAGIGLLAPHDRDFRLLLVASAYLLIVGWIDDRVDIHARHRLGMQAVAAAALAAAGVRFSLGMGAFLAGVVTVVWVLGVVNATNCLDCTDGAAGTFAVAACGWFFVLALHEGRLAVAVLPVVLMGALLAFLRHNLPPASIFMGDLGSTFLGLILGILSVASGPPPGRAFRFPVEALVLVPAVYDFVLVHARRYRAGTRNLRDLLSSTGKDHLPHRLLGRALTPREACLVLALLPSVWGMAAWHVKQGAWLPAAASCLLGVGALLAGEPVLARLARKRVLAPNGAGAPEAISAGGGGD